MISRRTLLAFAAISTLSPIIDTDIARAAAFSWDGTWSGTAANGRRTVIKIT